MKIRLVFVLLVSQISFMTFASGRGPLLWDMEALLKTRSSGVASAEYGKIISDANKYEKTQGPTVMDKPKCWSGDKHNFETVAPYFWPDPNNPNGKYICKDGQVNPDYHLYDRRRIDNMADRCKTLSTAFYLTRDTVYSSAWLRDMRRWFIDKSTMMYPQFDYAQIIPTITTKGVPGGIIEAYVLTDVVDGILMMDSLNVLPPKDAKQLKTWFKSLANWMCKSYDGQLRFKNKDNIGTASDVLFYSLCIYTNNKKYCREIENSFFAERLNKQITTDGKQTEELKRTLSMKYSIYNLTHIIDFCTMAKKRGVDVYGTNKQLLDNACNFVKDIVDRRDNSQYQESGNWETYSDDIKTEIQRLQKLGDRR